MNNQNQLASEIYVSCASVVDDQLVQKIFNTLSTAINNHVKTVHLLIHSTGGTVQSGIAIYNFLTNIPINIITYNGGWVASSAILVYLAGKVRKASANAIFIFHKTSFQAIGPISVEIMKMRANNIERDDTSSEAIWEKYITMSDEQRGVFEHTDLTVGAEDAKTMGLIHEIADFKVPDGSQFFNI